MNNPDQLDIEESIRRTSEEAEADELRRKIGGIPMKYIRSLKEIPPEPPTAS